MGGMKNYQVSPNLAPVYALLTLNFIMDLLLLLRVLYGG